MNVNIKKLLTTIAVLSASICILFSDNPEFDVNNDSDIIRLIGEDHNDPECIKLKKQLSQDAMNGEIIMAIEGEWFGKIKTNLFGIEDGNTHMLSTAFGFYNQFVFYKIIKAISSLNNEELAPIMDASVGLFDQFFMHTAERIQAICVILDRLGNDLDIIYEKYPRIVKKFHKLYQLRLTPKDYDKEITKLIKNHCFEKPFFLNIDTKIDHWINLFNDIIIFYSELAIYNNEKISQDVINEINIRVGRFKEYANMNTEALMDKIFLIITELVESTNFQVNIELHHRNKIFLKHIISIFEDNKAQKKPFYVLVGLAHTPFLFEELKAKGYEVELNDMAQEAYNEHLAKLEESVTKSEL